MSTFSARISIRLREDLRERLAAEAAAAGKRESDLVREALKKYLTSHDSGESAYDVAKRLKLIGCVTDMPPDSSTNPAYFEGFGSRTDPPPRRKKRV